MAENVQTNATESKPNDKEYNFRALEQKLKQEQSARIEAEKKAEEALRLAQEATSRRDDREEDDNEPYVDHKRLDKKLSSFEKKMEEKIDKKAEEKASHLLKKKEQEDWVNNNPDFYQIMQLADKFAEKAPMLAQSILRMPEGFERQQLVYNNIKAMGLDKPEQKQASIQEKIDANKRSPYYQPTGIGTAPYSTAGDFSPAGQKQAYEKLQELKSRLRI